MQTSISGAPWFEEWFDSSYYHLLYRHRNGPEAAGFIDRLLLKLRPAPGPSMLDLGCGSERHSVHLAEKGYDVTGYDPSFNSILKAKAFSAGNLRFEQKDMRHYLGFEVYDYLFSFFALPKKCGCFSPETLKQCLADTA